MDLILPLFKKEVQKYILYLEIGCICKRFIIEVTIEIELAFDAKNHSIFFVAFL